MPKYVRMQPQKYGAHITVTRPEYETPNTERWGEFHKQEIEFYYKPIVYFGEVYFWIDCYSKKLEMVRDSLNLYIDDKFDIPQKPFRKTFHLTIGNNKWENLQV